MRPCFKILVLTFLVVCVNAFCLSIYAGEGKFNIVVRDSVSPLKIGDTIPEWLWKLPLEVADHPAAKTKMSLQDYRGKRLIILDFWATWCGACIAMMDKTDQLQKANGSTIQIIPITYEPASKVSQFVSRRSQNDSNKSKLFTVYNQRTLQQIFTHKLLPHYVWISSSGVYLGSSNGDQLTQANISKALNGTAAFKQKIDYRIPYQKTKGFLQAINGLEDSDVKSYTIFGAYKPGMPPGSQAGKLGNGMSRLTYTNGTLTSLLAMAYSRSDLYFGRNRIKFLTEDSTLYVVPANEDPLKEEWRKEHLFSYERVGKVPVSELRKAMQQDLKQYFPELDITTQHIDHLCWVMKGNTNNPKLRTKGGQRKSIVDRDGCSLRNTSLFDLYFFMNFYLHQNSEIPFEWEIEDDYPIDLEFFTDMTDMDAVNSKLEPYGIKFVLERRPVEMIVVTDKKKKGTNDD